MRDNRAWSFMRHFASGNANHDRANFGSPGTAPGACDHDEVAEVIDLAQVSDAGRSGLSRENFLPKMVLRTVGGRAGGQKTCQRREAWLCRRRRPGNVLELYGASGLIVGSTTLPRLPSQDEVQMSCALD